jgi:hypothetical protein
MYFLFLIVQLNCSTKMAPKPMRTDRRIRSRSEAELEFPIKSYKKVKEVKDTEADEIQKSEAAHDCPP